MNEASNKYGLLTQKNKFRNISQRIVIKEIHPIRYGNSVDLCTYIGGIYTVRPSVLKRQSQEILSTYIE
jgi:hypothetical protein